MIDTYNPYRVFNDVLFIFSTSYQVVHTLLIP